MHDTKMTVSWLIILGATVLAFYLGYRSKTPKQYGGVFGTLLVYSCYGFLPLIIMFVVMATLQEMNIWGSGGDTDIGPALTPLLMSPIYWVSVFLGMGMSKKEPQ